MGPLARYLAAATLARGADAGAPLGLVLLATSPLADLRHGAAVGGLLAAGLTAPHLLGPWVARRLDAAKDGRRLLAGAFGGYAGALAVAAAGLGRLPLSLVGAAIVVAGACGPLLTGGLSSRLASVAGGSSRLEGWDALSYGLAGTVGPALVALVTAVATPLAALLSLAAAAGVAALLTLTLPCTGDADSRRREPHAVRDTLRLLVTHGPLRRVGVATLLAAFGTGGIAVIAAVFGEQLSTRPAAGATLAVMFGAGNLAGSLLVTAFPLRGEPERLVGLHVALMGVALGLSAAAPGYALALAGFALAGLANAPFFTATLAARSRYAPEAARAQVFVSMAGLKVASASAGAAVAGAAAGAGPRALLAGGAAMSLVAAAAIVADRRLAPRLVPCPSSPRPNAPDSRSSRCSGARSSPSTTATPMSAARMRPARSPRP